jgi:hypothetical protein
MRPKRRKQKPIATWKREKRRQLGREVALIWTVTLLLWGYTAWSIYSTFVWKSHVHIYCGVFLADIVFLALAIWLTVEWRRARDK